MSALPLSELAARAQKARPMLAAVAKPPKRASFMAFTAFCVLVGVLGMVGVLFVTTHIQVQSRDLRELQTRATVLRNENSQLEAQLQRLRAPEALAAQASQLGMRANPNAAYIDLESGTIIGDPKPVTGKELTTDLYRVDSSPQGSPVLVPRTDGN